MKKVRSKWFRILFLFVLLLTYFQLKISDATEFTDYTFLIAEGKADNLNNQRFWDLLSTNNHSGIKVDIRQEKQKIFLKETNQPFGFLLEKIEAVTEQEESKIFPVILNYTGSIAILDSLISNSSISSKIFFLPQGETWPSIEYLVQAKRNIIFFVNGQFRQDSHILHHLNNYALQISANEISGNPAYALNSGTNLELFLINDFDKLPTKASSTLRGLNMIPDYINFLLENWTKYGKRPNFLLVNGDNLSTFSFIISQLNSFTWINGSIKISGKTMEKVYWKSPDVTVTGGKFSFPYRGGEEIIISPFVPGYKLSPQQIVVTGEMEIPESYTIMANPIRLSDGLTGSFNFDEIIFNSVNPEMNFSGENFSFTQDIERGNVLKLPEKASVNLGNPDKFGIRNSSFTVSCFVKFSEILEFGDNAVLGNHESEYRKGLHLILRSGHPYFGLYSNDYVSEESLNPNMWYHIVWRYIIETGEQAIFLNGKNIGNSSGHPPFSGTGDIYLGSALSSGASMRGYIDDLYFWNRPLGNEEINRLSLNEEIVISNEKTKADKKSFPNKLVLILAGFVLLVVSLFSVLKILGRKKIRTIVQLPKTNSGNQFRLFGKFSVLDKNGYDISEKFTPKLKELLLFVLIYTVKNGNGALINAVNENLWDGIESGKVANNRAVTINKLRKILLEIDGIEIVVQNGFIQAKMDEPFFCDYVEAYRLCTLKGDMNKQQLEAFYQLVKAGRFLKDLNWPWMDEIGGLIGNQVIDNLLKLAIIYKKEGKQEEIDAIAQRILDYDDLNEEAVYLQIWAFQRVNNIYLAKFNFTSFSSKYMEIMGEPYPMNFDQFISHFSSQF